MSVGLAADATPEQQQQERSKKLAQQPQQLIEGFEASRILSVTCVLTEVGGKQLLKGHIVVVQNVVGCKTKSCVSFDQLTCIT
jgi:hypothetical protein